MSLVARSHQVHGNKVLLVNEPITTEGYDAMITNQANVYLAVSIADCCPVLIHDTKNNAVAAIHAGWRGTKKNIVGKTVQIMQEKFGCENIYA